MSKTNFFALLDKEVATIDSVKTSKRHERVIDGFTEYPHSYALMGGKEVKIFNSNDYLGLRHHPDLIAAEHEASETYGSGPGAVRFISGSLKVHVDLENALAKFHNREAAMVFSSAFATNMAVLFCLIQGQRKDTAVTPDVLVVSDALNHRSIIDGIRVANLPKDHREVFRHLDAAHLEEILEARKNTVKRALVVTDGVFSMLGEYQDLKKIREVVDKYDEQYEHGVLLVVDDCHGIAAFGPTGRGTEELCTAQADVLVGTLGKGFGADGGYVVASKKVIDYLRESAATYIYSNSISPGTAGAALASINLVDSKAGKKMIAHLQEMTQLFKTAMKKAGFTFAAESVHPIQPVLIGDAAKCRALADNLFERQFLVTNLSYPVVTAGRDELRVQLSASHTVADVEMLVSAFKTAGTNVGVLNK
ncbi:MAG: aminotransferase class I/II-fold pyridoxal phosphate-dependent enzyme [Patescibacteria group bacterium]|jgi:glycine C-acetyltransferase